MPELPEVETVVRQLREQLVGRRVASVRVLWPRTIQTPSVPVFRRGLVGRQITGMRRRAKYIVFELDGAEASPKGRLLVGHLRMTGRFFVGDDPEPRATRVCFTLDDGRFLAFSDMRKFGRLALGKQLDQLTPALGPEPLSEAFTDEWFAKALASRRRQLKPLLLDQAFLAGLGNIYVDEALHRAGLHPLRSAHRVPVARAQRLAAAIREVLERAIELQGASFDVFYRTPEGQPGGYQHEFQVYGRHGKPCRSCGRRLLRIVVGQRGTHYCSRCQPAPRMKTS